VQVGVWVCGCVGERVGEHAGECVGELAGERVNEQGVYIIR
jgi:hypothetical protein